MYTYAFIYLPDSDVPSEKRITYVEADSTPLAVKSFRNVYPAATIENITYQGLTE